jgi:hypothetical protein
MNNDATSSIPARQPLDDRDRDAPNHDRDENDHEGTDETSSDAASQSQQRRKAGLVKKLQYMTHLMKSLDMVVFAELCTLYYME